MRHIIRRSQNHATLGYIERTFCRLYFGKDDIGFEDNYVNLISGQHGQTFRVDTDCAVCYAEWASAKFPKTVEHSEA